MALSYSSSMNRLGFSINIEGEKYSQRTAIRLGLPSKARFATGAFQLLKGRNVVIEQSWGAPKVTKYCVTVAKSIELEDRVMSDGASPVKQVANTTNDADGVRRTCAGALAGAIITEGRKSVVAGMNAMDLRHGITMALDSVLANLRSRATMISTSEEIAQVGTIFANGEKEFGEMIAKAMEKVGKEGAITIQDGKTLYNELEVVEGMRLDRGYMSPYFITNTKNQKCELDGPIILIHEKKITSVQYIVKVLELAVKRQSPLLIVAEDVELEALTTLISFKRAGIKVCAINAPGLGENWKAGLHDLAALTGGQMITEELGMSIDDLEIEMFGSCKKVIISKDDTVVLQGAGDKKSIEARCEQIRSGMELSDSDYDKKKLQERLAKLSGGVVVLKIGGANEAEVVEKKDKVTNALDATKSAVKEGILPGGGAATLLYAAKELDKLPTANFDQNIGVQIIQNALKMAIHTIACDAGVEDPDLGYDEAKGDYMIKAGIIVPLKVMRRALNDAASMSCVLTETAGVGLPKDVIEIDGRKMDLSAYKPL